MSLRSRLEALRPALAAAAQAVIDEWEQDDEGVDELFGEGGACDAVAQAMAGALGSIDTIEGGQPGDDHAYLIAYDDADAFAVDIPPGVYETGGGYRWRKRPGVQISGDDVVIDCVNRNDIDPEMNENGRARDSQLEHTPNARRPQHTTYRTHLLVAGAHVPECNRMGRHASGFVGVDLNKYLRVEPQDRCERCDAAALRRCERIRNDKRAKGEPVPPIVLRWLGESDQAKHEPNHAAVHYVWLVDYRGVPLDTEGPYGPMSLARAEPFARIGATKGEHDRVVSIGRDVMAPGFEILRRYRRGTGERVQ